MAKVLYFITDLDPTGIRLALEHRNSDVGICLLQDAVYFGCEGRNVDVSVGDATKSGITVYGAKRDVELRGLTRLLHPRVKIIDYGEIIDLILNSERIVNM